MFYTLGPMISPMVGGILIDTLGWRNVFGFALLVGSLILVGAYMAVPESRPSDGPSQGGLLQSCTSLLKDIRFSAFVLQTGFSTGTFLTMATASATLMKELLHRRRLNLVSISSCFRLDFLQAA